MKDPDIIYMTQEWVKGLDEVTTEIDGRWVPARPLGLSSIWYRLRASWLVFTGKADALRWPGDQ